MEHQVTWCVQFVKICQIIHSHVVQFSMLYFSKILFFFPQLWNIFHLSFPLFLYDLPISPTHSLYIFLRINTPLSFGILQPRSPRRPMLDKLFHVLSSSLAQQAQLSLDLQSLAPKSHLWDSWTCYIPDVWLFLCSTVFPHTSPRGNHNMCLHKTFGISSNRAYSPITHNQNTNNSFHQKP